jgi:tetratricopeptide (TPR) repeat protein
MARWLQLISRCLILLVGAAICNPATARADSCESPAATVVSVQGTVELRKAGSEDWYPADLNAAICVGDTVRALRRSRAGVQLDGASMLRISAGTEMTFDGPKEDGTQVVDLLRGAAHILSRSGDGRLDVNTPFAVAGVRGTEFMVTSGETEAEVTVFEGVVLAQNDTGSVRLTRGQSGVASVGQAPSRRTVVKPRDAVHWALYYPPVIYLDPDAFQDGDDWRAQVRTATDAAVRGDVEGALAALDGVDSESVSDPRFATFKASLLLSVGSVDDAEAEIDRALALDPEQSDALALQSIVAVTQNDNDRALERAERAVSSDSESATALLALSYAQQARFDLRSARTSVERATQLEPRNALAWARLAELWASFGRLDKAIEAAREAASIEPKLARVQTVLGFVQLTRVDIAAAKASFEKAIAVDNADPMPRLGLGLARIREGDLQAGGREIEVAASLDSSSSLIRSYLGKTYFEEKRIGLDEREYATAKELDPNDPTPWFYDSIALQTTNRPVQALRANQRAIELNDNRAVFRSKLLLDSDLAARSAGLARIYGDLGFQNLALVEGWKSVNTDGTNFSAHRLLADSYAALPRHEIARVSELFQSQMLQPTNITPIQPRLGESNLFLLASQGPSSISTSEFNPIFNRNRIAAQGTGLGGEDDTYAGEGIVSAIHGKASFSAGYSKFDTDGFRDDNDQSDELATAFAQYEITPETSVQTEFRYRNRNNDDLELNFFEDDFSPFKSQDFETYTARGGLRHAFSPGSILLASYIYSDNDIKSKDAFPDIFAAELGAGDLALRSKAEEKAHSGEVQHLFRSEPLDWFGGIVRDIDVTTGAGYFGIDRDQTLTQTISNVPPPGDALNGTNTSNRNPDVKHGNVYAYSNIDLAGGVTLTLGVSGDFYDEEGGTGSGDEDQVNPKLGISWDLPFLQGTTIRGAAFRVLKRSLATNQTLEPTQVAGFNQFFDDLNGTKAWRFGAAVDQKFTKTLFGGGEFSYRDLSVPQTITSPFGVFRRTLDWDEYLGRAYLFWTPRDWVALRVEYRYEKLEREPESNDSYSRVTTHSIPLGAQFFHPNGLSLRLGATYLDQDGHFLPQGTAAFRSGDRDFWVLDAGIRYRLPKRYGFLSFGVNNFLDEDSTYQATDPENPRIRPGRFVFGSVTLAIP